MGGNGDWDPSEIAPAAPDPAPQRGRPGGRAQPGSDVEVSLSRQSGAPLLIVTETGSASEDGANLTHVLERVSGQIGAALTVRGIECRLAFPSTTSDAIQGG